MLSVRGKDCDFHKLGLPCVEKSQSRMESYCRELMTTTYLIWNSGIALSDESFSFETSLVLYFSQNFVAGGNLRKRGEGYATITFRSEDAPSRALGKCSKSSFEPHSMC